MMVMRKPAARSSERGKAYAIELGRFGSLRFLISFRGLACL
jgi:hypothetical protein